jgi:hypothetical protein
MAKTYSVDLRSRAIKAFEKGILAKKSIRQIANLPAAEATCYFTNRIFTVLL